MSIKSITIENFKGIREPVKFDLAPITLLYGPNSAGKSTLLQALAYLNDVINHEECNNDYTRAGGESMKLGGFMNIVNGHDPSKSIKFSIEYDALKGGWNGPIDEWKGSKGGTLDNDHFPYLQGTVKDGMRIDLSVAWDNNNKNSYIAEIKILMEDTNIVTIKSDAFKAASTIQINFGHPYFKLTNTRHVIFPKPDIKLNWVTLFDCIVHENSLLLEDVTKPMPYKEKGVIEHPYFHEGARVMAAPNHVRAYFSEFNKIIDREEQLQKEHSVTNAFHGLIFEEATEDEISAYDNFIKTDLGKNVKAELDELERVVTDIPPINKHINAVFYDYFNTIITGSIQTISNFLKDIVYVGPLRKIPESESIKNHTNTDSWHDGMAAWAYIFHKAHIFDSDLLTELNMYLGGKDYFNTGYHVKTGNALTLEMELSGELQRLINHEGNIDLDALRKQIQDVSQFVKILKLYDLKRGVDVNISDVGTGISQILPIILAFIIDNLDVIMVEQPELHIHPRLQVQMGELLVHSLFAKGKYNDRQKFHLIETHSEDLLLRLMRRIREPSAEGHQLKPSDLAIYYVDTVDDATRISERIQVDSEGDFIDEWPGVDGFFQESFNENFGGRG